MNVCSNTKLCHLYDNFIALFEIKPGDTTNIQVTRRLALACKMI